MDWEMCSCDGVILYIGGWAGLVIRTELVVVNGVEFQALA
jgi:hypothetical protein